MIATIVLSTALAFPLPEALARCAGKSEVKALADTEQTNQKEELMTSSAWALRYAHPDLMSLTAHNMTRRWSAEGAKTPETWFGECFDVMPTHVRILREARRDREFMRWYNSEL